MARWTDLAPWRGPTPNQGPAMVEHRGVVLHIADGWFEGTISWQKNPKARVSSHFIGGRAGGRAQMVDTATAAWTQRAGNGHWLSIEFEGFTPSHPLYKPGWETLTDDQLEFAAEVLARAHKVYGVPLQVADHPGERGLGHHSMDREWLGEEWGHDACPGSAIIAQKPLIVARARAIAGGSGSAGPLPIPASQEDDMPFLHGQIPAGQASIIVCTPWDQSAISFGCDFGRAKLRVAEHTVNVGWRVYEVVIDSTDATRHDVGGLGARRGNVDRRCIKRIPLDAKDPMTTPVGYLAWW